MDSHILPIPLARVLMSVIPAPLLARSVEGIVRRVERHHPTLFRNLARLDQAVVHIKPTDLPHSFGLHIGMQPVTFYLLQDKAEVPQAVITASLQDLVDMLEARIDGDALFFSRGMQVTGDTTVIVGLRNTLDREEINLYDEILSMCGPFVVPASMAMGFLGKAAHHIKVRLSDIHDDMHHQKDKTAL